MQNKPYSPTFLSSSMAVSEAVLQQQIPGSSNLLVRDARMKRLVDRRDRLGREGRRSNFVDNPEFLVYHWSGVGEGFAPPTGDQAVDQRINVGDNNCRVFLGIPFPYAAEMPSRAACQRASTPTPPALTAPIPVMPILVIPPRASSFARSIARLWRSKR